MRGFLGVVMHNGGEIHEDVGIETVEHPYLTYAMFKTVADIQFAPFGDAMGIGLAVRFTSMPGKGLKAKFCISLLFLTHLLRGCFKKQDSCTIKLIDYHPLKSDFFQALERQHLMPLK